MLEKGRLISKRQRGLLVEKMCFSFPRDQLMSHVSVGIFAVHFLCNTSQSDFVLLKTFFVPCEYDSHAEVLTFILRQTNFSG